MRLFIVLLLLLSNLVLQILFKYSLNDIPFSEISFTYLGNIFSVLLSLLVVLGAVILYSLSKGYDKRAYSTIIFITTLAILSYGFGYLISNVDFAPLNSYVLGTPSRKFYLALIFVINLFTQYYLLAYIWGNIIGRQSSGSGKAFSGALLALFLTFVFSYFYITSKDFRNKNNNSIPYYDVAVVLGAAVWSNNQPSTIFEGRIKKVHALSTAGKVRKIQFTGGSAPGEISEAKAAENFYNSLGGSGSYVSIEEETSTTSQQVQLIREEFSGGARPQSVVIISDDFHLPRTIEMCRFFNVDADGLASDYVLSVEKLLYYRIRESFALVLFWLFGI